MTNLDSSTVTNWERLYINSRVFYVTLVVMPSLMSTFLFHLLTQKIGKDSWNDAPGADLFLSSSMLPKVSKFGVFARKTKASKVPIMET